MSCDELSNAFDVLVSSYRRFKDFDHREPVDTIEFDEHEKSYYLTKAQDEIVTSLYNGKNAYGDSFESTEEQRRLLANLVREITLKPIANTSGMLLGMGSSSKFFTLPDDLRYITYEAVTIDNAGCDALNPMDVYPVTQDEYHKTISNPFRGVNNRRALRLDLSDGVVEIVCKYNVSSYYVRYIRKPRPIVLVDLPNNLTVEGEGRKTECELNSILHQRILEMAVMEALRNKAVSNDNK